MWYYGVLLTLESVLISVLLRRYNTRRKQRTKSDQLRWEQAKYETKKLRYELETIRNTRGLIQKFEEAFK